MKIKKLALLITIPFILVGCGKKNTVDTQHTTNSTIEEMAIAEATANQNGEYLDMLHQYMILDGKDDSNFFNVVIADTIAKDNQLFSNTITDTQTVNMAWKQLGFNERCLVGMGLYSAYLTRANENTYTSFIDNNTVKNYLENWYSSSPSEFGELKTTLMTAYYDTLKSTIPNCSYETDGNFLDVKPSVFFKHLYGLGKDEEIVATYTVENSIDRTSFDFTPESTEYTDNLIALRDNCEVYVIGSKGTVIHYTYVIMPNVEDSILTDVHYMFGGGLPGGIDETLTEPTNATDILFYGNKSMGELSGSEIDTIQTNFITALYDETNVYSHISSSCGIEPKGKSNYWLYDRLSGYGLDITDFEITNIASGVKPTQENKIYGDLYSVYEGNVYIPASGYPFVINGINIIHGREYGFSAESYITVF